MDSFLWVVSTAVMLALLGCLALRALRELLGLELRLNGPGLTLPVKLSPANWPMWAVFLASLSILWVGAVVSYRVQMGGFAGFSEYFWSRFTEAGDAPHYLFIAEYGYVSAGENVNNIVFYPLYPCLVSCLGALLGGRLALAGMILSQACYGLSAVVLAKLAKENCAHPGAVMAAYWLYPFGFFCLGVFTEGLFLLLTILGLYLIHRRQWIWAGLAGLLCALTRTQGILLLLPGVYCAWREWRESGRNWQCLALAGPVLGFGIYLLINKIVCGEFFAYQYYESIAPWWQTPQWLGDTVVQQLNMAMDYPGIALWIYWPQLLLYFIAAAILFAGFRRQTDTAWILYGTAYLGMCYTASWLISGGRYMLGCIPLYLCVGAMKNRGVRMLILGGELVFFWVYYIWFIQGQAIM